MYVVGVEALSAAWRAALEEAWDAYAAGTVPVGAAIADPQGAVVARGRNRIFDDAIPGQIGRTRLAHAEVNAILALSRQAIDPRMLTLFTTAEPCPLCVGATVMASIRALEYASRDPFAGSAGLLQATPYIRNKEISARGPRDGRLEGFLIAIGTEFHLRATGPRVAELVALSAAVRPDAVALGERLYRAGEWGSLRTKSLGEAFSTLAEALDSSLQGV
jgi:tRNA(adenine34) deaminase